MTTFAGRRWCCGAFALLLGAIASQLLSLRQASRGMMVMAAVSTGRVDRLSSSQIASQRARFSSWRGLIGIGLALAAVFCWVLTPFDRKASPQGVPIVLAAFYVLLVLTFV